MEYGKLFIGGISWDTNEESLKEYFQTFGEVIEAIIMKDRITGRARGFGFVVFADPAVAERVVKQKHLLDGRTVEAKKAVPRDDHQILNRSSSSVHGSPGPICTKKIFVGGLASSVTEIDFKNYFNQFGTITDVVVMYDHNTQRPRGFGFITYDSEESVDKVLLRTFHELNGKMVEVKRAVPKESCSSPGSNRSQISEYNYALSRASSFLNYGLSQGYNCPSYGPRMDGRFSPVSVNRSGYPPFSPSSYNVGLNPDLGLGINYASNGSYSSNLGYAPAINPAYNVASNRHADPFGYVLGGDSAGNGSVLNSTNHNMWANGSQNVSKILGAGIWGNSDGGQSGSVGGGNASFIGSNLIYGNKESTVGHRSNGNRIGASVYSYGEVGGDNMFGSGGGGSFYADPTWWALSPELEVSDLIAGYNLGTGSSDGIPKNSVGYVGYSMANRSNRGIAA